ncbi:MAG: hypothetical protein NTX29_06920 [Actinobacteria bacterium]|nr:hypothetical protein [Actinomycetota bacterium]
MGISEHVSGDLEDEDWADQAIALFEASDQSTRPIAELVAELGL